MKLTCIVNQQIFVWQFRTIFVNDNTISGRPEVEHPNSAWCLRELTIFFDRKNISFYFLQSADSLRTVSSNPSGTECFYHTFTVYEFPVAATPFSSRSYTNNLWFHNSDWSLIPLSKQRFQMHALLLIAEAARRLGHCVSLNFSDRINYLIILGQWRWIPHVRPTSNL